ncbi:hypothetical protein EST38_g10884 [Candolleomyces aberdarensis]|uniref:F-box domain-containing protein n=1 Tax=Candolleomyces aberdarensis TaxID=2316362 RepID=A0A4V1Q2G1_9AGAR|nr:hypothetical protein EST38_g10884 [Candolleomyces aberdarensis]
MDSEIALYSDLQELILQFLLGDFSNALKCCLVCKDWQRFCRPRLFTTLDFTSRQGKERFRGFVELLEAPVTPTFSPYVERIALDDRAEPQDIEALDSSKLVRLSSLSVKSDAEELVPSSYYFKSISKRFSRITHLDMTGVAFIMRRTFLDFICSFSELQTLAMGDARCLGIWIDAHGSIDESRWRLPPLKSLCLSMAIGETLEETFLGWLGNQLRSHNTLQTLTLLGVVMQPDLIRTFIECASPHLEELELDTRLFSVMNGACSGQDLNIMYSDILLRIPAGLESSGVSLPRLRTLKLGIPIPIDQIASREGDVQVEGDSRSTGDSSVIDITTIAALSKELPRAEAPQLQELVLSPFITSETGDFAYICPLDTLNRIRFTEFDKTLSQLHHSFPNLHTVSFSCEEHVPTPPNLESPQSLQDEISACRIPLPEPRLDPLRFGATAFPLTLAKGLVTLQVLSTSQDTATEALL